MEDLNNLTIVQLKHKLKKQNAKVSGNKSELISRLQKLNEDKFISIEDESVEEDLFIASQNNSKNEEAIDLNQDLNEKITINCSSCNRLIKFPNDHSGNINCPYCKNKILIRQSKPTSKIELLLIASILILAVTLFIRLTALNEYFLFEGVSNYGLICFGTLFLSSIIGMFIEDKNKDLP